MPTRNRSLTNHHQTRGFTLIELLVVVAVIALLVGIMLPAIGHARRSALRAGGASTQRQLFIGVSSYASSNRFDIPGVSTCRGAVDIPSARELLNSEDYPLTPFDWISPSIDDLPDPWEERMYYIFNEFADPALDATLTPEMVTGIPQYPIDKLRALIALRGDMTAPSYQMPVVWQADAIDDQLLFRVQPFPRRLDRVAGSSRKIAIADATAHESNSVNPGNYSIHYGCMHLCEEGDLRMDNGFLQFPPMNPETEAYTPESPLLDQYSYRHPGKTMNVMHWDGHSAQLTVKESLDPALWYPRGTEYLGGAHPLVEELYDYAPGDFID